MKSQVSGSLGKRTIQPARYWTLDQALIWLATDNLAEAAATEPFATYALCRELKHSYGWTQAEMLRLLRTVEGLAHWNGETVPTLWLHKATLVLGTPNHVLLNVPEFAAVLQRQAEVPSIQSAEFASFNIEGMTPSIDSERLIEFVAVELSTAETKVIPESGQNHFNKGPRDTAKTVTARIKELHIGWLQSASIQEGATPTEGTQVAKSS